MYPFGEFRNRKQKHPNTPTSVEYLILSSEPTETDGRTSAVHPRFTYANRYLVKRQVMRNLRRLKRSQPQ